MIPANNAIRYDSILLKPSPNGLQDNIRSLSLFLANNEGQSLPHLLFLQLSILIIAQVSVHKTDYCIFISVAIYYPSHLNVLIES